MAQDPLHFVRQGRLDAYVKPLPRVLDLEPIVHSLAPNRPCVWLDSARLHPVTGRWSILGWDPWLTLTARDATITLTTAASTRRWRANPFQALRDVRRRYAGARWGGAGAAACGLLGYLSYELNRWIERLPAPRRTSKGLPEMLWYGMRMTVVVDHLRQRSWLVSLVDPHRPRARARRDALDRLDRMGPRLAARTTWEPPPAAVGTARALCLEPTSTPQAFEGMVHRVLESIRRGDIFQANVAQRFTARWHASSLALYSVLRRVNPSPFACWLSWNGGALVSCSPERLVRVEDGWVETRPIAGTRPRGATPQDDVANSFELMMSEKERAEHIMLVDLARNDIGRVCRPGSIAVDELMGLEEYSHVMHIVSNVGGQLRASADPVDVIRALFPGGTITGCPKVRCMEILRELEPVARGLYTGSIGRLGFDGSMDLNIAIRTMVVQGERVTYHVGAGIVADSKPDREYQETLAKAQALVDALRSVSAIHAPPFAVQR